MSQKKKTTVARILNQYEIIIAVGDYDGIKIGDQFTIIGNSSDEITDPETGEVLGFIPIAKAIVRAKQVFDRFTICENTNTRYGSLFGLNTPPAGFTTRLPLNVRPEDVQGINKNIKIPPIEVGDEVDYVH